MKYILTSLLILLGSIYTSQTETLIASDYVETYDWGGAWWTPAATTGYYTDISVTPTLSAGIYGTGNNTREEDWYSLPSVTVDANKDHVFRMRLAAQTISGPTANTAGLDGGDYITVQLSKNGGGFVSELRVRGFANATWDYSSTAIASKISNGSLTIFTPGGGGDRTSLGDGYSYIELLVPAGPSSIAIDIYCRVNRGGEDWWMDNFELYEITQTALPVELLHFEGETINQVNVIQWATASENNSSHYVLQHSNDGTDWTTLNTVYAAGFSTDYIEYVVYDCNYQPINNYYQLIQYDINGAYEVFGPINIDNQGAQKRIIKYVNTMGQQISPNAPGLILVVFEDGTTQKIIR